MHVPSTQLFSWLFRQSPPSKATLQKKPTDASTNLLIIRQHIPVPKFDSMHPTWSSTSIPMLPILAPRKHEVALGAISSSAAFHVTATLSSSMVLTTSPAQSSSLLLPSQQKPNSVPSFSMHKRPKSCGYALKNSYIPNRRLPFTLIILTQSALSTTQSNANNPKQWKCNTSGYLTAKSKSYSNSTIKLDKRTWAITPQNTIQPTSINMSDHTMCK
jgi:hypothetical protein